MFSLLKMGSYMKRWPVLMSLALGLYPALAPAQEPNIVFASIDDGARILGARDDYATEASPFDRAVRLQTDRPVDEVEFLEQASHAVLPWSDGERRRIRALFARYRPLLQRSAIVFPPQVYLIKTTGAEQAHAPYTRANAIVIPETALAQDRDPLERVVAHELFHIASRYSPQLRDSTYRAIGFYPCGNLQFPVSLAPRKITNPDAPNNAHCIRVRVHGSRQWAMPILFSTTDRYDTKRGGELFDYLGFGLLAVTKGDDKTPALAVAGPNGPEVFALRDVSDFFEQVGHNTEYVIHPEEIVADHFALFLLGKTAVPSPAVYRRLSEIFMAGK